MPKQTTTARKPRSQPKTTDQKIKKFIPMAPQPETGDYVKGVTMDGDPFSGFLHALGRTHVKLKGSKSYIFQSVSTVCRPPETLGDWLNLIGEVRAEKLDRLFEEYRFYNLSAWQTADREEDYTRLENYKGWQILRFRSNEVDICKDGSKWYFNLKGKPELKSDDAAIRSHCVEAIDYAEGILAAIEEYEQGALNLHKSLSCNDKNLNLQIFKDERFIKIDGESYDAGDFVEIYKGVAITLCVPNGGIIAVDLAIDNDYYSCSTEGKFDYHDEAGIVAYARSVIDKLWGEQPDPTPITPAVVSESDQLAALEQQIQQGIDQVEAGRTAIWQAVATVQKQELWRLGGYANFEAYCKQRWGWEKSNAWEVAGAGRITDELIQSGVPESALPTSVSQTRQLAKLPPEKRVEVVQQIAASGEKLTAEAIKQASCKHTFEEVAALYATLPETEFLKHKNGSFNYAVNSCGYAKVYRNPDEALERFEWHKERVERYLKQDELRCSRCQFCEVSQDAWYCQKHKQNYTPAENPAPNCESYAPVQYGIPKPQKGLESAPTLEPLPQKSVQLYRGDRVKIVADDDLYNYPAIVDRVIENDRLQYITVYSSELPGVSFEYLTSDLRFVSRGDDDSLFELRQLMPPAATLTPQPVEPKPQPSAIPPEQRVAEKLIVEYNTSILQVAKKLLGWLPDDGLEAISEWMLDEKARRKGFANYEAFAETVQAKFFKKEAS